MRPARQWMKPSSDWQRTIPKCADLVKLRFFAGLTIEEAAVAMGISDVTADRILGLCPGLALREAATDDSAYSLVIFSKISEMCKRFAADGALIVENNQEPPMADVKPRVKRIFSDPSPEIADGWRNYLDQACGSDPQCGTESSTLRAHADAGSFLAVRRGVCATIDHPPSNTPAPRSVPTSCWSRLAKGAWASCTMPHNASPSAAPWP